MGKLYQSLLSEVKSFQLPLETTNYAKNIYWVFGILLKEKVPFNAEKMMKLLAEKNIGTRPFFFPMHLQPVFNKMGLFLNEKYPVAEYLAKKGFYIPSGLGLKEEHIYEVSNRIK